MSSKFKERFVGRSRVTKLGELSELNKLNDLSNYQTPKKSRKAFSMPRKDSLVNSMETENTKDTFHLPPLYSPQPGRAVNKSVDVAAVRRSDQGLAIRSSKYMPKHMEIHRMTYKARNGHTKRNRDQERILGDSPGHSERASWDSTPQNRAHRVRRQINWKPYKQSDFKKLQQQMKIKLGGIGAQINSEEWKRRKLLEDRKSRYSEQIKYNYVNIQR